MSHRLRRWVVVGLLALAGVVVLAAARLAYLPLIHGTTAEEVERLTAWLEVESGTRVADVGAGDGTLALALARCVGPAGQVYATELDAEHLATIRQAAADARPANVAVIAGAVSITNLPDASCEALFHRLVYHHLTDPAPINADISRALRPGGRLVIIDFEPRGDHELDRSAGDRGSSGRAWYSQPSRAFLRRQIIHCRKRGSPSRCRSAATASRDRSCRRPRSCRT
jgi:ubiquinone/menaquinone biosynthesis C-methylase UbiE